MILSFADRDAERLFDGLTVRRYDAFRRQALRRLVLLDAAETLTDLAAIPGNRLEALRGDRAGQHSVRVNRQWRVCFVWDTSEGGARAVEIVDYH